MTHMQVLFIGVGIVRGLFKKDGNSYSALSLLLLSVFSISTDSKAMLGLHSLIISDAVCHTDHHQFKINTEKWEIRIKIKQTGISLIPLFCRFSCDVRLACQLAWGVSQWGGRQRALEAGGSSGCAEETGHAISSWEEKARAILVGAYGHVGFPCSSSCATVFVFTYI